MKQINFNNAKGELTEDDVDQIVSIVGSRCRLKTVQRLRAIITYMPHMIQSYGILERLIKENGTWTYVAGQSYPDEIKTVRECILGK